MDPKTKYITSGNKSRLQNLCPSTFQKRSTTAGDNTSWRIAFQPNSLNQNTWHNSEVFYIWSFICSFSQLDQFLSTPVMRRSMFCYLLAAIWKTFEACLSPIKKRIIILSDVSFNFDKVQYDNDTVFLPTMTLTTTSHSNNLSLR